MVLDLVKEEEGGGGGGASFSCSNGNVCIEYYGPNEKISELKGQCEATIGDNCAPLSSWGAVACLQAMALSRSRIP